jgi:hypothetical protein
MQNGSKMTKTLLLFSFGLLCFYGPLAAASRLDQGTPSSDRSNNEESFVADQDPRSDDRGPTQAATPVLPPGSKQVRTKLEGGFQPLGFHIVAGSLEDAHSRGGLHEPAGVRVTQVSASGLASQAGLVSGDLILRVDKRQINTPEDMAAVLYTTSIGESPQLEVLRGQQRLQLPLRLQLSERVAAPCPDYSHPSGDYRFSFFPSWKLDSQLRRDSVTNRPFHQLESPSGQYRIHLFADSQPAPDARQALLAFQQEAGSGFLEGYSQWLLLGDLPAVFVSGIVGRERLFTLYRLTIVSGEKRFELDIYTPPQKDPARLPFVMEVLLGTLRHPQMAQKPTQLPTTDRTDKGTAVGLMPPPPLRRPPVAQSSSDLPQFSGLLRLDAQLKSLELQLLGDDKELATGPEAAAMPAGETAGRAQTRPPRVQSEPATGASRIDQLRAAIEQMEKETELNKPVVERPTLHSPSRIVTGPGPPPGPPPGPRSGPPPGVLIGPSTGTIPAAAPGRPPAAPGHPETPAAMLNAQAIAELRRQAMEIWTPPMEQHPGDFFAEETKPLKSGWMKSEYDPGKVVELFKPLRLKPGFVLRAYVFHEEGNATGVVWALPHDAPFPNPDEVPVLEQHLFKAPKPWDAVDDFMDVLEGDGSAGSYLAASMLRRELNEFGAAWHGIEWGSHCLLDADPWQAAVEPQDPDDEDHCLPTTPAKEWEWQAERPRDWQPKVQLDGDQVTVTFYTYVGKYPEKLFRHTDTYRVGRYRARVRDQPIGQGPGGYLF